MSEPQRVAILGVTGFVGTGLAEKFHTQGWSVTGLSRKGTGTSPAVDRWQRTNEPDFRNHAAVVNLTGEPIDQRWTESKKREFHESRIGVTQRVVEAIRTLPPDQRPRVLVNASAVGIYGDRHDEILTDNAASGSGYLADLCREWESAAQSAESLGVRVVRIRIGIVLGREGSAFKKLITVFKSGIGGRLGSGKQWMPWIHVEDLRAAIVHAATSDTLSGPVNGSAPNPERNADFTKKLAAALHRPALIPAPGFALKIVLGEFGGALLAGQRAIPKALETDGFRFSFPTFESAIADLLSDPGCIALKFR
jgi:uncharacterized protein (TIGR01777 family)